MSIAVLFHPTSMGEAQYREILRRLESTGLAAPHGREYHICYGRGDDLLVLDIWQSAETLQAFGATLTPIAQGVGSDPGNPDIFEVVNTIEGTRRASAGLQERNKAVSRRYIEGVFGDRDLTVIDELVSREFVGHDPDAPDFAGLRAFTAAVLSAFPDIRSTVDFQVADGDLVTTHWTCTGTQNGEFMGMPATGRSAVVSGIQVDRVVNGRIVESWNVWDRAGLMRQLGVLTNDVGQPAHA